MEAAGRKRATGQGHQSGKAEHDYLGVSPSPLSLPSLLGALATSNRQKKSRGDWGASGLCREGEPGNSLALRSRIWPERRSTSVVPRMPGNKPSDVPSCPCFRAPVAEKWRALNRGSPKGLASRV